MKLRKRDVFLRRMTKKGAKHAKNRPKGEMPHKDPNLTNHDRMELRRIAREKL